MESMAANIEQSLSNPISLKGDYSLFAIPGLGVDGRIFNRMKIQFSSLKIIEWLEPKEEESLTEYASRMSEPIRNQGGKAILLGYSFGGVVAQEIERQLKLEGLILLSTIKYNDQRPWFFSVGRKLPLYQYLKGSWRYETIHLWGPFAGIHDPEEQELIRQMFKSASQNHRQWGANQIVKWQGNPIELPFIHIHGEKDQIFKCSLIKEAEIVKGAGHTMPFQQAEEVATILRSWMKKNDFLAE
jgi:pimeloyl-ACP methyl ester carboxylesterase